MSDAYACVRCEPARARVARSPSSSSPPHPFPHHMVTHRFCRMTAPIQAINWLKVSPPNITGAELALNRSMFAAAFGPFNVRNEVDIHTTTVGAHYTSAPFLTGDGGFLQVLLNGYAGLMLARQDGMQLNAPTLPPRTTSIRILGILYLNYTLDVVTDGVMMSWNTTSEGLCLFRPPAAGGERMALGVLPVALNIADFFGLPVEGERHGKIGLCS